MEKEKYLNDLKDIKDIMNRSSRSASLSGLSGMVCGCIALVGAYFYYAKVYSYEGDVLFDASLTLMVNAILIGGLTFVAAFLATVFFTVRRSRKCHLPLYDTRTLRMVKRFSVPFITGALLCLIAIYHDSSFLLLPISLIAYGLATYSASPFTYNEFKSQGIINIALGLLSTFFLDYALVFWALGFGVLNIIYGIVIYKRHES